MNNERKSVKRKRRFSWFRLLGLIVTVLFIVQLYGEYGIYLRLKEEEAHYREELTIAQADYQAVIDKQKLLNNDSYVERVARDNLGMVKPGEIRVTTVKTDAAAPNSD
ncbi:MAG: septum formation initiator family protein, partial [Clostridiales bacterium]